MSPTVPLSQVSHVCPPPFCQPPPWSHLTPGGLLPQPCAHLGAHPRACGVPPWLTACGQSQTSSWRRWDSLGSVTARGGGAALEAGWPTHLRQLSGDFPTGERGAERVKEHRAPHLLLIQEGHTCPPPSPAHPWGSALVGAHRLPQPGGPVI